MKVEHYHIFYKTKSGLISSTKCNYETLDKTPLKGDLIKTHYNEEVEFYNFNQARLNNERVFYEGESIIKVDEGKLLEKIKINSEIYLNALYNLSSIEDLNTVYDGRPSYLKNIEYSFKDLMERKNCTFNMKYSKINYSEKDIVDLLKNAYNELIVTLENSLITPTDSYCMKAGLRYSMTKVAYELSSYFSEDVLKADLLTRYDEEKDINVLNINEADFIENSIYNMLSYENKKELYKDLKVENNNVKNTQKRKM